MMDALLKNVAPRTLIMAMGGLFLLVVAAFTSYGLWPKILEYRMSLHTIEQLENVVANANSMHREIENAEKEIIMLNRNLHGEVLDMPNRQMEAYVIGRLQEISWKNSVKLLGVRPGTANTVTSLEEIPFDVEVSGDYFDLYAWMQDFRSELGFLAVRHFNISPLNSGNADSDLKASFTLVSYREAPNG
jgi:Tfp pilus assembly protein PilO